MKHTVTLRNGVQVPALGLGTWFLGENKAARAREMESLRTGISAGMTLIDTAEMYGNGKAESLIKEVISDKKRDTSLSRHPEAAGSCPVRAFPHTG